MRKKTSKIAWIFLIVFGIIVLIFIGNYFGWLDNFNFRPLSTIPIDCPDESMCLSAIPPYTCPADVSFCHVEGVMNCSGNQVPTQNVIFRTNVKFAKYDNSGTKVDNKRAWVVLDVNQDNLLAKIFKSSFEDDVYLILDRAKDNWRFKVINSQADIETSQLITQYLPANFSIFFGGVNLLNIFSAWGQVDQSLADSFDQVSNSFAMIYQFDLQQEIYDLFDQAGDLVIFSFEDQNRSVFDFVFIVPKDSSVNLENLEKLIKIVLAQESPAKVEYLLSDGTTVTEIKADPAAFEWQSKTINNQLEIRYLQQPELGFEIAYLVSGGNILLSSKIDLIQQTINSQDILLRDLVFGCGLKQGSEIMVFNKDKALIFPFLHYLPGDIILITKDSNYLLGCVLDK